MGSYDNFILKKQVNVTLGGYHWTVENPQAVICLVHGIGECAGRYDRMAGHFADNRIATLSFDLRGHGISSGLRGDTAPRQEILEDVDRLLEVAEELYPEKPLVLYGHSMGGNIVLDYRNRGFKRKTPKGYILSAPWLTLAEEPVSWQLAGMRVLHKVMPKRQISSTIDETLLGNPEQVRPYHSHPLVHNAISLRCALECFDLGQQLAQGKEEKNDNTNNIPTYLLHGDQDQICHIEGSRDFVRNHPKEAIRFEELEGYYHEIHNGKEEENGEKVIEKIITFIQEVSA